MSFQTHLKVAALQLPHTKRQKNGVAQAGSRALPDEPVLAFTAGQSFMIRFSLTMIKNNLDW